MSLINRIKIALKAIFGNEEISPENESIYEQKSVIEQVHSLWDYIKFNAQSQAFHICNVLGFEEWVSMDEILRRVKEMFGVNYKNERSLYPYIKTLVDCGLLESSGFTGKKHWRKRDLIIKIEEKEITNPIKQTALVEKKLI